MSSYMDYPENDPRHHTMQIQRQLRDLSAHLREDVTKVHDPKARALFETSAEVLDGLTKAFQHFETEAEEAWKSEPS
jgi:hypothetical protein